jgi:hypothetical protein
VTFTSTGNFRHALAVYTGAAVNTLTAVTNQMAAAGATSNAFTFSAVSGVTYQIAVDGYNAAVGTVSVSHSQSGGIFLGQPARLGDGLIHFNIFSSPGAVLGVLASTNLVNWVPIAVVTNTSGIMDFADPASATLPRRFYRLGPASAVASPMVISGAARQVDGNLRFTVSGDVGQVFRVLANTNLGAGNWITLGTLTNLNGTAQFTDLTATNHPRRFYRTAAP